MHQSGRLSALIMSAFAFTLLACSSLKKNQESHPQAATLDSDLTWSQAKERKARLDEIHYDLTVHLDATHSSFTGSSEIHFKLKSARHPLRLDFFEGEVKSLNINGREVGLEAKKTYWIELPAASLKVGANVVKIEYRQSYSRQGQGLHRFEDPQSKEVFLHTQFQTFDANRFMPCFDQPDLRSILALKVEAPASWEVISTTRESSIEKRGDKRFWIFPATPRLATYLFSLHAGPYKVWTDKYDDIPLRLFARPSLAKHVRSQDWFTYTKQGLKFFNDYFGYKYPFQKYDQLVVPEFNSGAMENVGAVTFSERFIRRSQPTRQQRFSLASVLLHEMAHMWFGDLVTMQWWNDLWLNESFATYMSALAMAEGTEFKESWQDFFASDKNGAYWADGLITTHPIEADVKSVKEAYANFDSITYGKGASVMKQLSAYLSPAAFQKGIQDFIATYAYKNANLSQFIASLQKHTDRNLQVWAERWLKQTGVDRLAAHWACDGNTLKQIELRHQAPQGRRFREQTVQLLTENAKPAVIKLDLVKPVTLVNGSWSCPEFVYPNFNDDGYLAVTLDHKSSDHARRNLSRFTDPLLKTMVWDDLWEMVRNAEMPLKDYVQILNMHFARESDPILLNQLVGTISGSYKESSSVLYYWPENDERSRSEKQAFIAAMEKEYLRRHREAKAGSDEQRRWFDHFVALARSEAALDQISRWALQKNVAPGMPLDLDRQWSLVRRLMRYQHPKAKALLARMIEKDPSDWGKNQALASEAVQPDLNVKKKWLGVLQQDKSSLSLSEARSVMRSLFPVDQEDLAKRFAEDFYSYLEKNGNSENEVFVRSLVGTTVPLTCTSELSARLRTALGEESLAPSVEKVLKASLDEDERCQKIRARNSY